MPNRISAKEWVMKVADLMQTDVHTVTADMPVSEAIVALEDGRISGLPVVDARNRVVGVVSSTDIIGAQAETHSPEEQRILLEDTRVQDIMTPRPLLIEPDADVAEAARHMLYAEVHRLFVEDKGVLVGVISQTDIVQAVATGKLA
jgi:Predicted transcriptional regulator, contains C-terminal CBS domains